MSSLLRLSYKISAAKHRESRLVLVALQPIFDGYWKRSQSWRIGETSCLFATTDSSHSDNYAPTGLLGPFRGRFQAWRAPGPLAARNRPWDRRGAGERVHRPGPSRSALFEVVSIRCAGRRAFADQRPTINCRLDTTGLSRIRGRRPRADRVPTPRAATRRALLSVCRAADSVRVCGEIPGSGAPRRAPRSPTGFASDRRMLGIAAHQPRTPSAGDRPRPCDGAARQSSRDGGADRSRAFEEWLEVLTHGVVEECLFWLVAFVRNRSVVAETGVASNARSNRGAGGAASASTTRPALFHLPPSRSGDRDFSFTGHL
jgi:hypothetical protein